MDYQQSNKELSKILNDVSHEEINSNEKFDNLEFKKIYKGWVTSVSVDIRNFTNLVKNTNPIRITKIIQSFTSGIISIGKSDDNFLFTNLNGNEIILIYKTPHKEDDYNLYELIIKINTWLKLWKKRIRQDLHTNLNYGIAIVLKNNQIVCKYGHKYNEENSKFTAVGGVIELSSKLNSKNVINKIAFEKCFYDSLMHYIDKNKLYDEAKQNWFNWKKDYDLDLEYYLANITKPEFNGQKEN